MIPQHHIPQTNPRSNYLARKKEIDTAILSVLDRGQYILGKEVELFEKEFASYLGANHAVGVASGTDALFLALRSCGAGTGDEVITVSHTAVATVAAIEQCGAKPVFVDIDSETFNIDARLIKQAITKKTKVIVPVHLYGLPADMKSVMDIARKYDLKVIEDCAQAHGAVCEIGGKLKKVGTLGDAAGFSFYPTKNLSAIGDGGCVVTNNRGMADKVISLRQYGWGERYVSSDKGWNSRLDEIQAAILRVKLKALDADNGKRQRIADIYNECLVSELITKPFCPKDKIHVYHQYVIRVSGRDAVREQLSAKGIKTAIHYPVPVHLQPAYKDLLKGISLPMSEKVCREIISLPIYPEMPEADVRYVAESVVEAVC